MEALGVLYGLSHNRAYVYKPMFNGFYLVFVCIVYSIWGVFNLPMDGTRFLLDAKWKETQMVIALIFSHLFTFVPLHNIWELQKSIAN